MKNIENILQINTRDQRGGAERIAKTLFLKYQELGLKSWLIVGKKYGEEPNVSELSHASTISHFWSRVLLHCIENLSPLRQYGIPGVAMIQVWLRRFAQPNAWYKQRKGYQDFDYPGTWNIVQQIPEQPDIIHAHNLHGDYFDLRALPSLSHQYPFILHLHDIWLLSGHCAHSLDCERWRTGCGQCPYPKTYPAMSFDRSAENWQQKKEIYAQSQLYILTVSQWLMDKVNVSMLKGGKNRVIHNGVDLSIFCSGEQQAARSSLNLPPQAHIILYTAHSSFKDSDMMNTALQELQGENLLFICLGQVGKEQKLGQGRLLKTGYINSAKQMAQYYQAADLYLHIAKADSFPTTVLESLACGTPVVATAVGGIPEQIKDGETGFLIPSNNIKKLVHSIQTLLDNRPLRTKMGQFAAIDAQQRFDIKRQIKETLDWYEEVRLDWEMGQSK